MRLDDLLGELGLATVRGDPATTEIRSVTHDSRTVGPGSLFCCLPGAHADGHDHAPAAVAAGAVALLCERLLDLPVPQVVVPDARAEMARVAAAFHRHPSRALRVAGVTGTNGKTTVTHLLASILEANGWPTGVIGTLSGVRTTPESTDLQTQLAQFRDAGCEAVAMEVSSHALELHRVDATWFSVAVFTNLSRDHLDFHPTMEAYFAAKARLFTPERAAVAVVNLDDPRGRLLQDAAEIPTRGFRLADAGDLSVTAAGSTFTWEGQPVRLAMGGRFNVANALAAAAAARELGVPAEAVARGLSGAGPVPGRFESVDAGQPFGVVVDYAHTPDGLDQLLRAARDVAGGGRVLAAFGCGGDRDREKRPAMGEVAARLADLVVVTSDNPRSEDPAAIIDEVVAGVRRADDPRATVEVEPDRRAAIRRVLEAAAAGDVVVIAGKGHETTQTVGDRVVPFDDRSVAREEIGALAGRGGGAWSR